MKSNDIHIPPEALQKAWEIYLENNCGPRAFEAAVRAALAAWPGMHTHEWQRPWLGGMSGTDIILPLNTENPDAEA